ncbi:MAG TPA: 2-amino-4-hydroxy-6-hydroxymethyldihydropteridine diphosphokinase [Stellaceae bacterium]|jgi:2-amino-4-hydroxy-6-hydroxymethyldihydropteridine diphosphokinase|nr:2-amino-4-hydroxy-6-hydroxymethyldihydropteridine diphosphokinase [Stellaceae bacterium]
MILIGLGGNLPSNVGAPDATIEAAIEALAAAGLWIGARSRNYRSAPVPASDQPWYVNAAIAVTTELPPRELLALLHRVEAGFGRERREVNGARTLDLDLLAYDERVQAGGEGEPNLPHPRLHHRAFVLLPLGEVAPGWRHPITGDTVEHLIAALPPDQVAEPI